MKSLKEITVDEIIDSEYVSVSSDDKLSKLKKIMEDHNIKEVPVVDDNSFKGVIPYTEINKNIHKDPTKIKAKSLVATPPEIEGHENLVDVAERLVNSGNFSAAHLEGDRLLGVVNEKIMVSPLRNSVKEFHNLHVKDLMAKEIIVLKEDEKFAKARKIIEDKNLNIVPVVSKKGRIMGKITSLDLLKTMGPREQMRYGDAKGQKDSISEIPAREIMDTNLALVKDDKLSICKAVKKMRKLGTDEVIVIDEEEVPYGILTQKDLVEYMSTFKESEELIVNLVGIDNDGQKRMIYEKVEAAVQGKISRLLNRPRELKIHVKTFQTEGRREKYSINLKLYSELGTTIIKKEGWELLDVMDQVIDSLKEKLTSQKEKRRDRIRDLWKKGKYNK